MTKKTKTQTPKKVNSKSKILPKINLEDTNKTMTTQKVISHRVIKYKYPRSMKNTVERKSFRQKVRNRIRKFDRDISNLRGEDRKIMKQKLKDYQSEYLF